MKDHDGDVRGFYHLKESWYGAANLNGDVLDEVNFGLYSPDGGTSGEMCMEWKELGGQVVPYLIVFDDAWHTLWTFRDLLKRLAGEEGSLIGPKEFCAILSSLGFVDKTLRKNPYGQKQPYSRETMLENVLNQLVDSLKITTVSDETTTHIDNARKILSIKKAKK
jgi:hypothetical protein